MTVARIATAAATALLAAAALHRIAAHNPHLTLPTPPVVAALATALAIAAFGSRLWGALLLVPVALLTLPWFSHPFGLLAALVTAALSVAEVALWSIWLPVTVRSTPTERSAPLKDPNPLPVRREPRPGS